MNATKEKSADAARIAKFCIEIVLTEEGKTEKAASEAERHQKRRGIVKTTAKQSLKRQELKLRDGVLLNLVSSKSLKRFEFKLRDGVS